MHKQDNSRSFAFQADSSLLFRRCVSSHVLEGTGIPAETWHPSPIRSGTTTGPQPLSIFASTQTVSALLKPSTSQVTLEKKVSFAETEEQLEADEQSLES